MPEPFAEPEPVPEPWCGKPGQPCKREAEPIPLPDPEPGESFLYAPF